MDKRIILLATGLGGTIGSYLPTLLGVGGLGWGVLGAFVGGLVGIYAGYQLGSS